MLPDMEQQPLYNKYNFGAPFFYTNLAFGIDNIFNEKYFLFHPFPQRTYVVQGKLTF